MMDEFGDETLGFLVDFLCDETVSRLSERYVLGDVLGEGRFSQVRKGKPAQGAAAAPGAGEWPLALKGMALAELDDDDEALQMLEAEVGALRRAASCEELRQHVVRLHQVVRTNDTIYLALDLVPGLELFLLVEKHGALPEPYVRTLMAQLMRALAMLHGLGARPEPGALAPGAPSQRRSAAPPHACPPPPFCAYRRVPSRH